MMNRIGFNLLVIGAVVLTAISFSSCSEKDKVENKWVTTYKKVTIGGQDNLTIGHFFEPQTGEVIAVENTAEHQQYIGLLFFTESGGANTFLTFPADGNEASTFGTTGIRLFTQNPGGINYWDPQNLVSGMIYLSSMTSLDFDNLVTNVNWDKFNNAFVENNNGKTDLSYKVAYELNPHASNVYLIEFNGVVRAILCVRNVVPSLISGSSIRFDIIVEGRDSFSKSSGAEFIAPLKP